MSATDSTLSDNGKPLTYDELRAAELAILDGTPPAIDPREERSLLAADSRLAQAMARYECWGGCSETKLCANCQIRRRYLALQLHRRRYGRPVHASEVAGYGATSTPPEQFRQSNGDTNVSTADSCEPFPCDSLPEPIRNYADACANAIGCPIPYVVLPILTVLAAAIGNSCRIQLKRGWSEPAILWTGIIGESGTMKSPAIDHAREFPRRRQQQAFMRFQAEMAEHEAAVLVYQADLAAWKKKRGERGDPPQSPAEPILQRCLIDDCTIEAVAPILRDNWRGALILKDELAGFLGGFDRYVGKGRSASDAPKWIEMHGGRPVLIDRKTGTQRIIYVPRAALSVCGGIQPGIMRRLIGQEHRENGLLARLLMSWPERRPRKWSDAEPAEQLTADLQCVYDRLWELSPMTDENGEATPQMIRMSEGAKAAFVAFVNDHGEEQFHLDGDLAAAWSKLEGYAARLALLHHLVRWAQYPAAIELHRVDEESMLAGIAMVGWFGDEDRRIYAVLEETLSDTSRRELVDLIRRRGGSITVRQLQQASRRYQTAEAAEAALIALVTAGLGAWMDKPSAAMGGRITRIFCLS
jgi:Protein of unknown function (DUF3987)